ncbi:MAG TPA: AI-2E family transporter [Gemmatimonadaceae bacterium]|jgi:predicted PurR-regulated permease PerM|nr:AI-2E family transporter [Gemmatimonadaceae bacterium]
MTDLMEDCVPPHGPTVDVVTREPDPPLPPRTASRVTAVILVFATLYFAKAFFVPVAMAVVLYILLMPLVRSLTRRGAPRAVGAGIVMAVGVTVLGLAAYELASPARNWLTSTPTAVNTAARKWHALSMPLEKLSNAADRIAEETTVGGARRPTPVVVQGPSLSSRLFGTTESLLAGGLEVVILLYALLVVGDRLLLRVVHAIPRCRDRQRVITISRAAEALISRYLFLTAAINIGEGALVAVAMAALGMPTPVLWGAFVAVAEFVPYVGMITMTGVLSIAGLAYFDSLSHALLVPASYLVINFIQGNIVSPLVMSRRLTLNPVAIFLSLALWWWLWGVAGAFLAVPMLAALKICCDHVDSLAAVGALLGDPSIPEPVAAAAPAVITSAADSVSLVA